MLDDFIPASYSYFDVIFLDLLSFHFSMLLVGIYFSGKTMNF